MTALNRRVPPIAEVQRAALPGGPGAGSPRRTISASGPIVTLTLVVAALAAAWCSRLPGSDDSAGALRAAGEVQAADSGMRERGRPDVLKLASLRVSSRLHITAEHHRRIVEIDWRLDRDAAAAMAEEVRRWRERGGFHAEPAPNFVDPTSAFGARVARLRRSAETEIVSLLSEKERARLAGIGKSRETAAAAGPAGSAE